MTGIAPGEGAFASGGRHWPASEELDERVLAIEAVSHAHPDVRIVAHLLVSLVEFLRSGQVSRQEAVAALHGYIAAEPARVGAVETLEFVCRSLAWDDLRVGLEQLRDSPEANFRNRDLARYALRGFDAGWSGSPYRTFAH